MESKKCIDTEEIMWAIAHVVVEAAKTTVLEINKEGRRQSISGKPNGAPEAIKHRTGSSLGQPFFNCKA